LSEGGFVLVSVEGPRTASANLFGMLVRPFENTDDAIKSTVAERRRTLLRLIPRPVTATARRRLRRRPAVLSPVSSAGAPRAPAASWAANTPGTVVMRNTEVALDSDVGRVFVLDCARYTEGLGTDADLKAKWGLSDWAGE
jgi:outer membrane receptor protein involved in Fe transport